jgi:excisionase family DNA binding protein
MTLAFTSHRYRRGRIQACGIAPDSTAPSFNRLIDARAASELLGVPHTWLLARARAGGVPHHRLGHYVRFDPQDLSAWLAENRIEPRVLTRQQPRI